MANRTISPAGQNQVWPYTVEVKMTRMGEIVKVCPSLIPSERMSEGVLYFLWALTTVVLETYVFAETTVWAELMLKDGEVPEMCGIQCGEGKHKKFYGKAMYPWALAAFATGALSVLFIVIDVVVHQYRNTRNIIETEYLTLFSAGMTLVSYQFTYIQFTDGLGAWNALDGFRDIGITLLFLKGIHAFMMVVHHVVAFSKEVSLKG